MMSSNWEPSQTFFLQVHIFVDIEVLPCKTLIYETPETARHQGSCLLFRTQPPSLLKWWKSFSKSNVIQASKQVITEPSSWVSWILNIAFQLLTKTNNTKIIPNFPPKSTSILTEHYLHFFFFNKFSVLTDVQQNKIVEIKHAHCVCKQSLYMLL